MITNEQIKELEDLLADFDFLSRSYPYKIRPGETMQTMQDAMAFVDSSFETVKHNRKSKWFVPYYDRLYEFLTKNNLQN